jgi:biopolymer transport protein ExbB/TolQ
VTADRQQRKQNFVVIVLSQLGWPLFWGLVASVGFYTLIWRELLPGSKLMQRYLAAHPVEYAEGIMFFIGAAALLLKLWNVVRQQSAMDAVQLPPAADGGDRPEDCPQLLSELAAQPAAMQDSYLVRRFREALQYVQQKGSADELDDQLRYQADMDAARQHDSYALARLVIWAIPILGFLGTVIGITEAISGISPESFAKLEGIQTMTAGLGVAFDTTAIALILSMILMFAQYVVDRIEGDLVGKVDERVSAALVGRFESYGGGNDPQTASIRKMTDAVIRATERLVTRQAELWQETIDAAHAQWSKLSDATGAQTQQALRQSLAQGLELHASRLAEAEQSAAKRNEQISERLVAAMQAHAQSAEKQHAELARQGEIMLKAIEASGRVSQLQQVLNDNLRTLAGAKNFEDTVMSLSAAIHLLTTRLSGPRTEDTPVKLEPAATVKQGRAA